MTEPTGIAGLQNLGNTCYLNSVLQALIHTEALKEYFKQNNVPETLKLYLLSKVVNGVWSSNNTAVPISFVTHFFTGVKDKRIIYSQNDVTEALAWIFEIVTKESPKKKYHPKYDGATLDYLKDKKKKRKGFKENYFNSYIIYKYTKFIIDDLEKNESPLSIFRGSQVSILTCMKCNKIKYTFSAFDILPLDITDLTLNGCLENSNQSEVLDGENRWFCKNCNQKVPVKKEMTLYGTGEYVIIQLKRFTAEGEKITALVAFDESIILNGVAFELYSICNHHGGVKSGHYTNYSLVAGKWYSFDDESVQQVKNIVTANAYVLFYKKK